MYVKNETEKHFAVGCYTCPVNGTVLKLEEAVPRPWVHWPVRVQCKACGQEHVLEYDDVHQDNPVFGRE